MDLDAGTITALGTAVAVVMKAVAVLVQALRARRSCTCDCHDVPGCERHAPQPVS